MPPPLPDLPGVRHGYATVGGVRLHYAEAGEGPPVVLQHGWPQTWWCWHDVIPALARERRVICPDLRGFGWSEAPERGYAKLRLMDDLLGLLDVLGLERVTFVGHDWGAFIGFLAGLHHPERIDRLVALSIPPPWLDGPLDLRRAARFWYMGVLAAPVLGAAAVRHGFASQVLRQGRGHGRWEPVAFDLYRACIRRPGSVAATVALYRTFLTRELREVVAGRYDAMRLTVPTRLIVGALDPVVTGLAPSYDDHADDLTIEHVEGAGHFLPEERPELVTERIRAVPAAA